jgi:hypothetical protein
MSELVFLEVIDADGNLRTLWEDKHDCLHKAHLMQQGKMTIDGRPTKVSALVCMSYLQEKPNAHIDFPVREVSRWKI